MFSDNCDVSSYAVHLQSKFSQRAYFYAMYYARARMGEVDPRYFWWIDPDNDGDDVICIDR